MGALWETDKGFTPSNDGDNKSAVIDVALQS